MTALSTQGYVGGSIEDVFMDLEIRNENFLNENINYFEDDNMEKNLEDFLPKEYDLIEGVYFKKNSQNAIIYLDELDKITGNSDNSFNPGLQNELIGYLEESNVYENLLNTKNMLFIGTGAFSGLEEIISKRVNKRGTVGFKTLNDKIKEKEELFAQVTTEDFVKYGLKPKLIARFPNISYLKRLNKEDLINIMNMKNSDLNRTIKTLEKVYNINLKIPYESKEIIADYVLEQNTNARGIHSAINKILGPFFLDSNRYKNKKIIISPKKIRNNLY